METKRAKFKNSDEFNVGPASLKILEFADRHGVSSHLRSGQTQALRRASREGMSVVKSGLLKLQLLKPAPRILRLVAEGDVAGIGYWRQPASDTDQLQLTAIVPSEISFLSSKIVEKLIEEDPVFNRLIFDYLLQTIRHKDERIASLESRDAQERVARLLLSLAQKFGQRKNDEIMIGIDLDRDSYAQLACVTPETYSRMISVLADHRLVYRSRRRLVIPNVSNLTKYLAKLS